LGDRFDADIGGDSDGLKKSAGGLYRRARREAINYRGDDSMSRGKIRIPHALG